jgi:hypothetical protein
MLTIALCPTAALQPSALSDEEIAWTAAALEDFINTDVAPRYGQGAVTVVAIPRGAAVPGGAGVVVCTLEGHTDVPGAFGYHRTDDAGQTTARVFVLTCQEHKRPFTVSLSHEIIESMVNRHCNAAVLGRSGGAVRVYLKEACDPVESSSYVHSFRGKPLRVANYVYPAYWWRSAPGPYDHEGVIHAPLTPSPGGRQLSYAIAGAVEADVLALIR